MSESTKYIVIDNHRNIHYCDGEALDPIRKGYPAIVMKDGYFIAIANGKGWSLEKLDPVTLYLRDDHGEVRQFMNPPTALEIIQSYDNWEHYEKEKEKEKVQTLQNQIDVQTVLNKRLQAQLDKKIVPTTLYVVDQSTRHDIYPPMYFIHPDNPSPHEFKQVINECGLSYAECLRDKGYIMLDDVFIYLRKNGTVIQG